MNTDVIDSALTDGQLADLDLWCDVLDRLCAAWSAAGAQNTVRSENSPAAHEDAAVVAGGAPGWHAYDPYHAGMDAALLTDCAAWNLRALRSLATTRTVVLAPWPHARHVAEYAGQAGWLLDPEIRPDQRVARRWMLKLANLHRTRQTLGSLKALKSEVRKIKQERAEVEDQLRRRFPGVGDLSWKDLEQGPPWEVAGQRIPGLGELVRGFVKNHGLMQAPGVYDLLSLRSHPNLDMVARTTMTAVERDGFVQYRYEANVPQMITVMRVAALVFYRAAMAVTSYFALDDARLLDWYDSLPA